MNSDTFSKGDILEATHRQLTKGYHYIVFFEGYSKSDFCGCMITHSNINENIPMEFSHFEEVNSKGELYKVKYDNTFLVKGKFLKSEEWGPFEKVGKLTTEGINLLDKEISDLEYETFGEYYKRHRMIK